MIYILLYLAIGFIFSSLSIKYDESILRGVHGIQENAIVTEFWGRWFLWPIGIICLIYKYIGLISSNNIVLSWLNFLRKKNEVQTEETKELEHKQMPDSFNTWKSVHEYLEERV